MKALFVGGLVGLVTLGLSAPASAQIRIGATVRVSDDAVIGVAYRSGHLGARLYVGDHYRRDHTYRKRVVRQHARDHRKLAREHRQYHRELARAHAELHDLIDRGYLDWYDHAEWHDEAGYDHDEFHHELEHEHEHQHEDYRFKRGKRGKKGKRW